jgi:hypothetical protein
MTKPTPPNDAAERAARPDNSAQKGVENRGFVHTSPSTTLLKEGDFKWKRPRERID